MPSRESMLSMTRMGFCLSASAMALLAFGSPTNLRADDDSNHNGMGSTRSPIKHVVTIIGENRGFDHVFGLYKPKNGESIANLLSRGILKEDGLPGPRFAQAVQFQAAPQATYYVGISPQNKTIYNVLPPPDLNGTPMAQTTMRPPFPNIL